LTFSAWNFYDFLYKYWFLNFSNFLYKDGFFYLFDNFDLFFNKNRYFFQYLSKLDNWLNIFQLIF